MWASLLLQHGLTVIPFQLPFASSSLALLTAPQGAQSPRRCRKPQKSALPPSTAMFWVRGADSQMCYSTCSPVVSLIRGWSVAWKMLWPTEANRKKKGGVFLRMSRDTDLLPACLRHGSGHHTFQ